MLTVFLWPAIESRKAVMNTLVHQGMTIIHVISMQMIVLLFSQILYAQQIKKNLRLAPVVNEIGHVRPIFTVVRLMDNKVPWGPVQTRRSQIMHALSY